jgi:hypothetical protein
MKKKGDIYVTDYIAVYNNTVICASIHLEQLRFQVHKWGLYQPANSHVDIYHLRDRYYEYLHSVYTLPIDQVIDVLVELHGTEGAKQVVKGLL